MKVFVLAPNEDWICDRFVQEWKQTFPHLTVDDPDQADVVWLLADWAWNQIHPEKLTGKRVIASIHHLVPEKFGDRALQEFIARDKYVTCYHVPCKKTEQQVREVLAQTKIEKPVWVQPFWVNETLWNRPQNFSKQELRKKHGLPEDKFLIGSFQRDTEGHDLVSPKLEKGPDLFCDIVAFLSQEIPNIEVVLGGWRRQYVMKQLTNWGKKFYYFELPPTKTLRELYLALDLYVVSARYEGGPQAIVECAALGVPIISTDVGLASEILDPSCIIDLSNPYLIRTATHDSKIDRSLSHSYESVKKLFMPQGMMPFLQKLEGLT